MNPITDAVLFGALVTAAAVVLLALGFGALVAVILYPELLAYAGITAGILWWWHHRQG